MDTQVLFFMVRHDGSHLVIGKDWEKASEAPVNIDKFVSRFFRWDDEGWHGSKWLHE